MGKIRALDLCCGGQSFKKALEALYGDDRVQVVNVDIDWKAQPEICRDLRDWDFRADFEPGSFDVVWASPPCTEYSRAKSRAPRRLELADSIAGRCLEIIDYFEPRWFFIENPDAMMKTRPFMQRMERYRHTCTYCQYGTPYKKPTNIWTNREGLFLKHCSATPCDYKRAHGIHEACAQGGPRAGFARSTPRESAYAVPQPLMAELLGGLF